MAKETKKRVRPTNGVAFTVWSMNGGPLPEDVVAKMEEALDGVKFEFFNDGLRLLSQTTRG